MEGAIAREKQIKGGSRAKKIALIEAMNPAWRDLFEEIGVHKRGGSNCALDCFVAMLLAMTARERA